jgi:hypothetical protein
MSIEIRPREQVTVKNKASESKCRCRELAGVCGTTWTKTGPDVTWDTPRRDYAGPDPNLLGEATEARQKTASSTKYRL